MPAGKQEYDKKRSSDTSVTVLLVNVTCDVPIKQRMPRYVYQHVFIIAVKTPLLLPSYSNTERPSSSCNNNQW